MNKDGTGLRRITNFYLTASAWSPDGNWLAFCLGSQIYKIRFTGTDFDTTSIVQLTNDRGNFFPSWTANSDSIYYDSNEGTNGQGYYVWKMTSDGSSKTGFQNTGDEPFVGSDNRIYYVGLQNEIYSMNKDASDIKQLTFNSNSDSRGFPKYYNGNIYYWESGWIYTTPVSNYSPKKLLHCADEDNYTISPRGKFVYTSGGFAIQDIRYGTLWTANFDGSNQIQMTFNHY